MAVLIETTLGDLVIDLFVKERPKSSFNFLMLCKMKYYNLCQFHSIEHNYIAQSGDPTGTGRGGESIFARLHGDQARYFEAESVPKMRHLRSGLVSMVNNGADMFGSQFFITLADDLDYLDDKHTIFGQVTEGLDTLETFNKQLCDEHGRPFRDIRIAHTLILDNPFDVPLGLTVPSRSPSPSMDIFNASKIALDERLNEDDGKTEDEIRKELEDKDMKAQAQILEMIGDLRHADERPPDNVLFVCKLNPVTTDEDLQIIFSRFGKIECCEIIRDRRTSASLQYAFIEFEEAKSCENAYFKMDNVLIDDRRIHVDFSQSVAKNFVWKRSIGSKADADKSKRTKSDTRNGEKVQSAACSEDGSQREADRRRHHRSRTEGAKSKGGESKSRDHRTDSRSRSSRVHARHRSRLRSRSHSHHERRRKRRLHSRSHHRT